MILRRPEEIFQQLKLGVKKEGRIQKQNSHMKFFIMKGQ